MTQLLLIGDSLVADYDWQKRMPTYTVHNHGAPGFTTTDVFNTLPEIKKQVKSVDVVMVMVGTNDLLTDNFDFLHTLKKIIVQLNSGYPLAEIILCSLFPMDMPHLPHNTISSLNSHIEALTMQTGSCFLDTHQRMIGATQKIFQDDGVHLTADAYEIWCRSLLEHIAFLIESD